jgi:Na+/melibiose symporter-like transporter
MVYHFGFHSSVSRHHHDGPQSPSVPKHHHHLHFPHIHHNGTHADTVNPDVEKSQSIDSSEENTKRLIRRIDVRLVPILSALYLLCFLCRQNIGNAKTYHMTYDLGLSTQQYQLALTVFFFSYSTFDIPCNIMLKKLRPSVWLPLVTLLSGIVTTFMGIVKNADQLIVVRFLLGMTEVRLPLLDKLDEGSLTIMSE